MNILRSKNKPKKSASFSSIDKKFTSTVVGLLITNVYYDIHRKLYINLDSFGDEDFDSYLAIDKDNTDEIKQKLISLLNIYHFINDLYDRENKEDHFKIRIIESIVLALFKSSTHITSSQFYYVAKEIYQILHRKPGLNLKIHSGKKISILPSIGLTFAQFKEVATCYNDSKDENQTTKCK